MAEQTKEELKVEQKRLREKLKEKASAFKVEYKKQVSTAIIAAFGLIIALSWRDVINDLVVQLGLKNNGLVLSAVIVTAISIIAISLISRWAKSGEVKK